MYRSVREISIMLTTNHLHVLENFTIQSLYMQKDRSGGPSFDTVGEKLSRHSIYKTIWGILIGCPFNLDVICTPWHSAAAKRRGGKGGKHAKYLN